MAPRGATARGGAVEAGGPRAVYLDWAATAPPQYTPPAAAHGNPSSAHALGRAQAARRDAARATLAAAIGRPAEHVVVTSGATEANNLLLLSLLTALRAGTTAGTSRSVVTTAIEHPSILEPARQLQRIGLPVTEVEVDSDGRIDLDRLLDAMDEHTRLVAVMTVNNEVGVMQPVTAVAEVVRDHARRTGQRVHLHTDAVQALGKGLAIDVDVVESLALSAHKIGGPPGVGALVIDPAAGFEPLLCGGGQESGRRPGTENVTGLEAFAERAARTAQSGAADRQHAGRLLEMLLAGADQLGLAVVPERRRQRPEWYSPYILCLSAPGVPAEVLVRVLSDRGVYVSRGSACASAGRGRPKVSPVLLAMGIDSRLALGAFRVSTGAGTTTADVSRLLTVLGEELPALRAAAGVSRTAH